MNTTAEQEVKNYISKGVDNIIDNKDDFIKNLAEASNIKPPKASKGPKADKEPGKTLKSINNILKKDGHRLERDEDNWPLYHLFLQSGETYDILFKKKVSDLFDLLEEKGIDGMLEFQKK